MIRLFTIGLLNPNFLKTYDKCNRPHIKQRLQVSKLPLSLTYLLIHRTLNIVVSGRWTADLYIISVALNQLSYETVLAYKLIKLTAKLSKTLKNQNDLKSNQTIIVFSRKEVFQPHLRYGTLLRLSPSYQSYLGGSSRSPTGHLASMAWRAVCARPGNIHRSMADLRLLAIPASRSRVETSIRTE